MFGNMKLDSTILLTEQEGGLFGNMKLDSTIVLTEVEGELNLLKFKFEYLFY